MLSNIKFDLFLLFFLLIIFKDRVLYNLLISDKTFLQLTFLLLQIYNGFLFQNGSIFLISIMNQSLSIRRVSQNLFDVVQLVTKGGLFLFD
jgi:hypothetical protein